MRSDRKKLPGLVGPRDAFHTPSGHGAYGKHVRRMWRHAPSGGWFSYELAIAQGQLGTLMCTYWGGEIGARTFDILVNDTIVGTQTLDGNHPESFYDVAYPIPPEFTKDGKATVTSKPHQDNTAGGVFGVRTIK